MAEEAEEEKEEEKREKTEETKEPKEKKSKKGKGCLILVLLGVGFLVLIGLIGAGGGGGQKKTKESPEQAVQQKEEKQYRFEGRLDAQPKDIEILVGESADLEGLRLTVSEAERATSLGTFEKAETGKEFVVLDVLLENVSDETQSFNVLDFRIQTAGGQVIDSFAGPFVENALHSGDLIEKGKVQGKISFEVPKEEGHQYILYKPNAWQPDRIVVQIQ